MKQKKNIRQRGGKTHGWGSMKKHRGAGNRGGRGNAGSGKRADQKKPSYWNASDPKGQKYGKGYFGKHGFASIHAAKERILNVRDIDTMMTLWLSEKKASKSGDTFTVDLGSLGVEKLLGTGRISKKVRITVSEATPLAVEKISSAGGVVTVSAVAAQHAAAEQNDE